MAHRAMGSGEHTTDRSGLIPFFSIALGLGWGLGLPATLATWGLIQGPVDRYLGLLGLSTFSPAIAAIVVSRSAGRGGARALLRRLRPTGAGARWYFVALVMNSVIVGGALAVARLAGLYEGPLVFPPGDAQRVVALFVVPFAEELGWRGFALPRLLERMSFLRASLVLGLLWGLWHIPMLVAQGLSPELVVVMVLFFVPGSVTFTWLFERSRGSLLVAVLAHMGAHLSNPHQALPTEATPALTQAVGYAVVALLILCWPAVRSVRVTRTGRRL